MSSIELITCRLTFYSGLVEVLVNTDRNWRSGSSALGVLSLWICVSIRLSSPTLAVRI